REDQEMLGEQNLIFSFNQDQRFASHLILTLKNFPYSHYNPKYYITPAGSETV
ncbi:unnamed protein product, partial [marine sediment metagenome]